MNKAIEIALHELYRRQIVSREQLLVEMLRVKMTHRMLAEKGKHAHDPEIIFQTMKKETEATLGFFPADRHDFYAFFVALEPIELISFAEAIYQNDRMGTVISPHYVTNYIKEKVKALDPHSVLIPEAEKHLGGLKPIIDACAPRPVTLTTQHKQFYPLLKFVFQDHDHVEVVFESIYAACLGTRTYAYIFALPNFGTKPEESGTSFMTKDSDGIAMENLLTHLDDQGTLDVIVPAKITFATRGFEELRAFIANNYHINQIFLLPEGTFRPATSIRTYFFSITGRSRWFAEIQIGTLHLEKEQLMPKGVKPITRQHFLSQEDWRIELLLAKDHVYIQQFVDSPHKKVKLKEVAEVFRGKSILKKDTTIGRIGILNLSNIGHDGIDYAEMDTIEEEERKIKRYELAEGDVVLSCRGTAIKTAVFHKQDKVIIASANVIVIRPKEGMLGAYLKIFLDSPIGMAIIQSFQRGTVIMNINHLDIMEMEIPLFPLEKQQELVERHTHAWRQYKQKVSEAEQNWNRVKDELNHAFM